MLTECTHLEEAANGIRAIGLSPGTVATQMQREIKASGINPVSQLDWSDHIPPDWVAKALLWMCGPEADAHLGSEISLREAIRELTDGQGVDVVAFSDEEGHFGNFFGSYSFLGELSEETIDTAALHTLIDHYEALAARLGVSVAELVRRGRSRRARRHLPGGSRSERCARPRSRFHRWPGGRRTPRRRPSPD